VKRVRRNREITAREVRVIASTGNQLGIMGFFDALRLAENDGLDLVEVSPSATPPVCRIMDYGKFLFEQNKKDKKPKIMQIKEVQFRPTTEENDYQVKLRSVVRFLSEGNKVKVSLRYKGREMAHQDVGRKVIDRLCKDLGEGAIVEQLPSMEGKQLIAVFAPPRKK
jgi:translation initiation factor IF-3